MRAKQEQNQDQPQPPDHTEALSLARELWSWLGEKTRYRDLVEGWIPLITRAREEAGLDWDRMRTVVRWAALENEYTVTNLRVSRDPGRSLFVSQWGNVVVFFEADEAAQLARARKKWKNGACRGCDMAEAKLHNHNSLCDKCDEKRQQSSDHVRGMLESLAQRGLVRKKAHTAEQEAQWFILAKPAPEKDSMDGAEIAVQGVHPIIPLEGLRWREMDREERIENMVRNIMENGLVLVVEQIYRTNTGFQVEEAE